MKIKKKERERERESRLQQVKCCLLCVYRAVSCIFFSFLYVIHPRENWRGWKSSIIDTIRSAPFFFFFLALCVCVWIPVRVLLHTAVEIDIHFPYIYSGWTVVTHLSICLLSVSEIFYFLCCSHFGGWLFLLFFFSSPIYDDESLFILLLYQNKYDRNMKSRCFFDSAGLRDQGFW